MGFKQVLVEHFTFLGKYKRWAVALKDNSMPLKKSYAQNREDLIIQEILSDYDISGSQYVDVGANHPTDISNTYLLYRLGYKGIIIEPNAELIQLFTIFRKRDIPLNVACGNTCAILKFNISKTPVMSSFEHVKQNVNIHRQIYIPVLPLDNILSNLECPLISLLNIDAEGFNYEVLEGSRNSLKKTLLLCIEFESNKEKEQYESIIYPDFELVRTVQFNLIYLNKKLANQLIKTRQ